MTPSKIRGELQTTRRRFLANGGVAAGVALFAASGEAGMLASTIAPHPEGNSQAPSQYSEVVRVRFLAPDLDGSNWVKGVGEEIITEFHEYNAAAEVEGLPISSGDILKELLAAVAAGQPPDISTLTPTCLKNWGCLALEISALHQSHGIGSRGLLGRSYL